eukprot:68694-Chlamydomonas_euryale.AAC.1
MGGQHRGWIALCVDHDVGGRIVGGPHRTSTPTMSCLPNRLQSAGPLWTSLVKDGELSAPCPRSLDLPRAVRGPDRPAHYAAERHGTCAVAGQT